MKKFRYDGYVLVTFFIILIFFYFFNYNPYVVLLSFPLSVIFLIFASDTFLEQMITFAGRFRLSERFTGTVMVSIISVVDEIAIASFSVIAHHADIGYGAIEGSTVITMIFFLLIIPLVSSIYIRRYRKDGLFIFIISISLLAYYFLFHMVPWYAGIPLILMFIIYMYATRSTESADIERNSKEKFMPFTAAFSFL
ncbi:MAG: hypothetical protein ACP5UV_07430, partial [Thermoplasmata archaeon]